MVQTGAVSCAGPTVSGCATPPAEGTIKRWPSKLKAMLFPSGEITGYRSQSGADGGPNGSDWTRYGKQIGVANPATARMRFGLRSHPRAAIAGLHEGMSPIYAFHSVGGYALSAT